MALRLRGLEATDLAPIEATLRANAPIFSEVEVQTAVHMLHAGLDPAERSNPDGYRFIVADDDGAVMGYALYAHAALTDGTFDLYWIAVHPSAKGSGAGLALLRAVEDGARSEGGRLIVLETSSRADYARARRFYERSGYGRAAVIPDFYKEGDDKVIYARRLDR